MPDEAERNRMVTRISGKPGVSADTPLEFRGREGQHLSVDEPLEQAAMLELISNWPAAMPFEELYVAARDRALILGDDCEQVMDRGIEWGAISE